MIAAGCILEGETVLLLAGFAAHRGYLNPLGVVAVAAAAAFAGNEFFFWLGRRHGVALLAHWPTLATHAAPIQRLIERYPSLTVVAVRFVYGTRVAGPILIGTSSMPQWRYTLVNALSAIAWSVLVGGAGWLFGVAAQTLLGHLGRAEIWLFAALLAGAMGWRVFARRLAQRRTALAR